MVFLKSAFVFLLVVILNGAAAKWRWTGKVAVVTGASSGIGEQIALTLADRGVIVVALARRKERLEALSTRTNGTIYAMGCDLLKEEEILSVFRTIEKKLGGVDILINNAGTSVMGKVTESTTEDLRTILDLNVIALTIATREALKTMRTRGDNGHIININSLAGHHVPHFENLFLGLYPASKFAVTALTEGITNELADLNSKIKVSNVSPGTVDTELYRNLLAKVDGAVPNLPKIEAQDIADGIIYILSTRANVQIPQLTIQPIGQRLC